MDFGLSASISFLKEIKEKCLKSIVQPYYEQSQSIYNMYHYTNNWKVLYKDIEYIVHLENIFTNDKKPTSRIFLSSIEEYELVELMIEVNNETQRYQDILTFKNLNSTTYICKSLPSIPLQYFDWSSNYRPYKDIEITIYKVMKNKEVKILDKKVHESGLTYFDILNHDWEERWGVIYNVNSINEYKKNLRQKYESKKLSIYEFMKYASYKSEVSGVQQLFYPKFFYLKIKTTTFIFDLIILWKMYRKKIELD